MGTDVAAQGRVGWAKVGGESLAVQCWEEYSTVITTNLPGH